MRVTSTWATAPTAELPRDRGKWCSTLVVGDDTTATKTYTVGPVGEEPEDEVTVTRRGSVRLTPGLQVGVADGNVGVPTQLTREQLANDIFITGNLVLDQAAGIGNGLGDLPAGAPATGGDGTGGGGTGGGGGGGGAPPQVGTGPGTGAGQYPPNGAIVVVNPDVDTGGQVVFRGGGCTGNEVLQVLFDGQFDRHDHLRRPGRVRRVDLDPVGTAPGVHALTIKGAVCVLNADITVRGGLAFTGSSSHTTTYVLAGVAAVVVGFVLVVGTRRRHRGVRGRSPPSVERVSFGTDLDERVRLLQGIWLFSTCTDDELGRIAALAEPREAETGDELTRQGEEGVEFFVIVEGDASAAVDGDEVGTIGPGGFFGEMALIDGGERVATVTATSPLKLLVLGRHDFNEMLEVAMPQIAPKLLAVVGARIRAIEDHDQVNATLGL